MKGKAWIILSVLLSLTCLMGGFLIFRQAVFHKTQLRHQQSLLGQQRELLKAQQNANLMLLLNTALENARQEVAADPKGQLQEATLASIAELSRALQPYVAADSLPGHKLSPERGQLLLALLRMEMNTQSLSALWQRASFAWADLRNANLDSADLRKVNLTGADMREAHLRGVRLDEADLSEAILWGAEMAGASLNWVSLKRADLRWADLNGARLKRADLNGARLSNARLKKADLRGAELQYAFLEGALLNGADMAGADLWAADLSQAKLQGVRLTEGSLFETVLTDANMQGVDLTMVKVTQLDWLQQLSTWQVEGAEEIQQKFRVTYKVPGRFPFKLEKVEE